MNNPYENIDRHLADEERHGEPMPEVVGACEQCCKGMRTPHRGKYGQLFCDEQCEERYAEEAAAIEVHHALEAIKERLLQEDYWHNGGEGEKAKVSYIFSSAKAQPDIKVTVEVCNA